MKTCCGFLMSTHNICFHGEIRKISFFFSLKKHPLSGPMMDAQTDLAFAVDVYPESLFSHGTALFVLFRRLVIKC